MGRTKDLWFEEYERIGDDYVSDCKNIGEEEAEENMRRSLRRLGFDAQEIDDHLCAVKA